MADCMAVVFTMDFIIIVIIDISNVKASETWLKSEEQKMKLKSKETSS